MKYYTIKVTIIILFVFTNLQTELKSETRYNLHPMVDTIRNPEFIPIINHWINYLYEDSEQARREYWSKADIEKYGERYCLWEASLFQYPRLRLLAALPPQILSVEVEGNHYFITTAFGSLNCKGGNDLAGIFKVMVVKSGNKYFLKNILDYNTEYWKKYQIGRIEYIIDPRVEIDTLAGQKANLFCDSLASVFGVSGDDKIKYYVTTTAQNLGKLVGREFSFYGYTPAVAYPEQGMLLTSANIFYFRHELVHVVLSNTKNNLFLEGIATYLGGDSKKSYKELLLVFAHEYYPLDEAKIDVIFQRQGFAPFYVFGAMLCELIDERLGSSKLYKLGTTLRKKDDFVIKAGNILGLSRVELLKKINVSMKKMLQ